MAIMQQRITLTPLKILRGAMNKTVLVKVKENTEFIGRLVMTDPTMNVVLEEATEYKDGGAEVIAKYGRILIRGSQILYICVDYTEAQLRSAST
ncbi:MAG: U6 snRNA-associated Sm-like protein LSm6 [Ignisphaera sp.]|jgi:small nuclear ribonucleoprotein|nr:U6 snRNA-associated Sm-like protein LSm6 [Ignisphaera sp.]MCC6055405.1 U6 snRNA-associated Sm-like protein LSm6 [Desulfurococcaceae archaeon]